MTNTPLGAAAPQAQVPVNKLYFTAWRWHFYAGLYVIPFMIMLALTGLMMMYFAVFEGRNGEQLRVNIGQTPLAVSQLQTAAEAAVSGKATQYIEPFAADKAALMVVKNESGKIGVLLDPYTAEVLSQAPWRSGWYDLADNIHGTFLADKTGDLLIEAAASLSLILVASGIYLHWPRNGSGTMFAPNLQAKGRALWKSLHAVIGTWVSLILVVFLISGLSWAGIWGEKVVQAWNTFPAEKWDAVPLSDKTHASLNSGAVKEVPWTLEQTPLPLSGSLKGLPAITGPVTVDSVVGFARALEFPGRFVLNFPADETGVWTISHDSMSKDGPDPSADRTVHLDQYTGNVLADARYAEYSAYAKAMAWGISFHVGEMGLWNIVFNMVFCVSVLFVSISGAVMWLKRRPAQAGRLAAPPRPQDAPFWKGAAVLMLVLGLAFPVGGAAMLLALIFDLVVLNLAPPLKRAFS